MQKQYRAAKQWLLQRRKWNPGIFRQARRVLAVSGCCLCLLAVLLMMDLPQSAIALDATHSAHSTAEVAFLTQPKAAKERGNRQVQAAYEQQQSNVIVENVVGLVEAILPDDHEGSRHQRFIMRLPHAQTVLVVHNIDLAPRINDLQVGDRVWVKGEYEWNERGGLIHWTHRDPNAFHEDGWIEHNNQRYE